MRPPFVWDQDRLGLSWPLNQSFQLFVFALRLPLAQAVNIFFSEIWPWIYNVNARKKGILKKQEEEEEVEDKVEVEEKEENQDYKQKGVQDEG